MKKHAVNNEVSRSETVEACIISTRIRLARNIQGIPFPHNQSASDADCVISILEDFSKLAESEGYVCAKISSLDQIERRFLREKNLITQEMEISDKSAVLYSDKQDFSILANDEDHIRIQVIKPGMQLNEAFAKASILDDRLNSCCPYAFSPEYGYLTASPSKLGTGMKASVMLHLPALTLKKSIHAVSQRIRNAGAILSGLIGSTGKSPGSVYIVSNKSRLGLSEAEILEHTERIAAVLVDAEDEAVNELMSNLRLETEDSIWRSMGLLSSARMMGYVEALEHLSNIRLGIILAVIDGISLSTINRLMTNIQWVHLQKILGNLFISSEEGDEARANFLRMTFNGGRNV